MIFNYTVRWKGATIAGFHLYDHATTYARNLSTSPVINGMRVEVVSASGVVAITYSLGEQV